MLVHPLNWGPRRVGQIHLPDAMGGGEADPGGATMVAEVVEIGRGRQQSDGTHEDLEIKVGDRVVLPKQAPAFPLTMSPLAHASVECNGSVKAKRVADLILVSARYVLSVLDDLPDGQVVRADGGDG